MENEISFDNLFTAVLFASRKKQPISNMFKSTLEVVGSNDFLKEIDNVLKVPSFNDIDFSDFTEPNSEFFSKLKSDTSKANIKDSSLLSLDIEDLLKLEGITSINGKEIRFGSKALRTTGNPKSHHRRKDSNTGNASARDISITNGSDLDYSDFRKTLMTNKRVRDWMTSHNWGIINEITKPIMASTKATGRHFHFGPDQWALKTWNYWLLNPNSAITLDIRKI